MKNIFCDELKKIQSDEDIILLDVRTQEEWNEGHYPSAIHIPLHLIPVLASERLTDKSVRIVCYCASGARSAQAGMYLDQLGYSKVYNLVGGFMSCNLV